MHIVSYGETIISQKVIIIACEQFYFNQFVYFLPVVKFSLVFHLKATIFSYIFLPKWAPLRGFLLNYCPESYTQSVKIGFIRLLDATIWKQVSLIYTQCCVLYSTV